MDRSELHKIKKPRFYVVDGNGYIYRAFFALPRMNNSKGMPTHAVYGFTNMIRKLLTEEKPEYIAVAFDSREKTFRHESYDQYKIDRPSMPDDLQVQIPYIRKICEALNLPMIVVPGYEADDVIATMMDRSTAEGLTGVIVTSDKDLLQLVGGDVYAMDPMKDYFVYDNKAVEEKWGVPPERIVDLLAIMGDSIDNIPGVKGIGPKGALELLQKFGTVESLLAGASQIEKKSHREKILEQKDSLILSRQLVQLQHNVPIDSQIRDLKAGHPNVDAARELFLQLEFYSIAAQFLTNASQRKAEYKQVETEQELAALITRLENSTLFSFHVAIDPTIRFRGTIVGIAFCTDSLCGDYIPLGHEGLLGNGQLAEKDVLARLKPVFENASLSKTAYNLKNQSLILRDHGIGLGGGMFDPSVMSYVLNPSRHGHGLDDLAKEYLQYQMKVEKEMLGVGQKRVKLSSVDAQTMGQYTAEITDLVREITPRLEEDLEKEGLLQFYRTMELPLIEVLAKMEWNGVKIDTATLQRLSQEMGKNLDRLVSEIYELAGGEFNINSPKQLGEVLFEKLKLPMTKKTRKARDFSTSADVLEDLAKEYELPQKILEYRQFSKLKSTYVDALPTMIDPVSKRVHTDYQQTVAATGRLSSTDPNLQNIPIRTPWGRLIRDAFVAEPGNLLLSADYSQIELRVMAHLSGDETLIDSFLKNEDIHARTASEVFDVPMEKMTKEIRNRAKAINYGINYGQSPFGLAQLLGIEQKVAKEFIDRYFEKYPKVKAFVETTMAFVQEHGYVETMFGRRRYIPEIRSRDRNVFLAAQRAAINTPLQGAAADIIKLAMIVLQQDIEQRKLKTRMTMQVHDELVFEVPEAEIEEVSALVKDRMENVHKLVVPLTVDICLGRNWLEAK